MLFMRKLYRILSAFLLCCVMGGNLYAADEPQPTQARVEDVTIATARGEVRLKLEIARTTAQIERGLMHREHIPERTGMIFLFAKYEPVDFWMKDTLVPLDILFIDENGTIINIVENTRPESTEHIPSGGPVTGVIEVPGGSARRLRIAKGDKVHYVWFHEK